MVEIQKQAASLDVELNTAAARNSEHGLCTFDEMEQVHHGMKRVLGPSYDMCPQSVVASCMIV